MTGGIRVYREGLFHGIVQSLRFNTTLAIGCFIVWTTQPRDLLLALAQLRVPATLAFMVTTALHFIPVIANEAATVFRSQRLRGVPLSPFESGHHLPRRYKIVSVRS